MLAALATALIVWIMMSVWAALDEQRDEHATLSAASAALHANLADVDVRSVATRLTTLAPMLETWQLAAAAFDAAGDRIGGDDSLHGDGLPIGRDAAAPTSRQVSVVPFRGGYVLLERDPRVLTRFRITAAIQLACALALAGLFAFGGSIEWIRARSRAGTRARDDFRRVASGDLQTAMPSGGDPIFGELTEASSSAIESLLRAVRERADGEDRLRAFLADAGHELRTPLAIAVGYVGILQRGGMGDPALTERIVRDVAAEHERLMRLVDNILHLARLDAIPSEPGAGTDVARVAHEAIALVRPLDATREISCEDRSGALAAVGADDLRDALRNLLENAIRYAAGAPIAIRIAADGREIVTSVRDEGPGMDAFTATHAFDRFFRGANREVPGTGLGLSIVRRVAERAGGRVQILSEVGAGTTVELRLPRAGALSGGSPGREASLPA